MDSGRSDFSSIDQLGSDGIRIWWRWLREWRSGNLVLGLTVALFACSRHLRFLEQNADGCILALAVLPVGQRILAQLGELPPPGQYNVEPFPVCVDRRCCLCGLVLGSDRRSLSV